MEINPGGGSMLGRMKVGATVAIALLALTAATALAAAVTGTPPRVAAGYTAVPVWGRSSVG